MKKNNKTHHFREGNPPKKPPTQIKTTCTNNLHKLFLPVFCLFKRDKGGTICANCSEIVCTNGDFGVGLPHRKISGPKSLGFGSCFLPEMQTNKQLGGLTHRIKAEKTMTATDVTGFDAIFSTGFFATFSRS